MTSNNDTVDKALNDFLVAFTEPEVLSSSILWSQNTNVDNQLPNTECILIDACKSLFQQIEDLGKEYTAAINGNDPGTHPILLSGLDSLYTELEDDDEKADKFLDAETIWGQVDLQNENLLTILKSSTKKLAKAVNATRSGKTSDKYKIQLLEDTPTTDDESDSDDNSNHDESDDNDNVENEDGSVDSHADRIKSRMARVMQEMEEDESLEGDDDDDDSHDIDDDDDEANNLTSKASHDNNDDESAQDPAAEQLNDGFFSISEMEAFADEEEGYLPDDAYGTVDESETKPKKSDSRSFHQKQRDGDTENYSENEQSDFEDDENDSDDPGVLSQKTNLVRRRNYRADDEIEALLDIYDAQTDDDSLDKKDPINMTAADLFGMPNKKRLEHWKLKKNEKPAASKNDNFDTTSWNDDFDDDEAGWRDSDEEEEVSMGDEKLEEDNDEVVPMKNKESKKNKEGSNVAPTKQIEKIRLQTEQIEKDMLAEKPWQMIGEAGSSSRPVDSLLDSTPEFEVATKIAPIITVEHTQNIEEIIKRRILNEDWDDVIPRELPDVGWHKKNGELPEVSQEKSKLGLGELYEREYLKKVVGFNKDTSEKESEEEKLKNEMKALFANLCSKLDALSNYHFAPRPIADEADIRPVTQPAIAMEEVLPLHVSNARGVAPEEVYATKRGRDSVLRADSELDQEERKRQRRSKKAVRNKKRKEKAADEKLISRLQPGLGLNNPYEKRKAREELSVARAGGRVVTGTEDKNSSDYGASTTFFQRMQAEAEQSIRSQKHGNDKQNEKTERSKSSSLKL